jgi:hypothetical protein
LSSILQALKKIESELPEKSEIRFWKQETDAQQISHRRLTDNLRFKKQYVAIFAVIILAAFGGLFLGRKPWRNIPSPVPKPETKHSKPISRIAKKTADRDLSQKKKSAKRVSETISVVKPAAKKKSPPHIKPREKKTVSVKKTENIVPKSSSPYKKKIADQILIQKSNNTKNKTETSGQQLKRKRILSIPVKQAGESKLQLQAIAWSSDPESRLAVVNGRVLREGSSIEKVLITHIGKNEVIFKKGGEEWKQVFRHK